MRRRGLWLVAAVALLAIAAWLMSGPPAPAPTPRAEVRFPRYPTPAEMERRRARSTMPAPPPPADPPPPDAPPPPPSTRDPVLAALPRVPGRSAVVVEANALRHSALGEKLVACLLARRDRDYDELRDKLGIDPLEDIDRVAVSGDVMVVSGFFGKLRWEELGLEGSRYGTGATVYDGPDTAVAKVGDGMVVIGERPEVEAAIDRLEGRAPADPPVSDEDTYGEVYGVLGVDDLARMMQGADPQLAGKLAQVAQRVRLHVSADSDVSMVAEVTGGDARGVDDLGRTLGATLALARAKARAQGDEDLHAILDLARVSPQGGSFGLELALPGELIEQQLRFCAEPAAVSESPAP